MKKLLKIVGIIVGGIVAILACIALWIAFTDLPTFESKSIAVTIPTDSAELHVGKVIVEERCAYCHLGDDGKLSGRQFSRAGDPFGEFWSRNITQDKEHGIGNYSDGQLAYLLRTGIGRHGNFIGPWMSSPLLSDKDLGAIIAYLRSNSPIVQPSATERKKTEYNFLVRALVKLGAFKPFEYTGTPVVTPSPENTVPYGKYLATARYQCYECHSKSFETNDVYVPEKSPGYFGGGNEISDKEFKIFITPNITMSKLHGIGSWTKEQFIHAVKTGEKPNGKVLSPAMPRLHAVDDTELSAIWDYLQTIPVIDVPVQK